MLLLLSGVRGYLMLLLLSGVRGYMMLLLLSGEEEKEERTILLK